MNKKKIMESVNPLFFEGICHRGLHNEEFTENGLKAFDNARNHHMALELDVHLTKDNQLIVMHDSDPERVTGKKGILENMTVQEIKENYRLKDGEEVPTLQEVFDLIREEVPIVVELKVYEKNYKPLAARLQEELKTIKDKRNVMLISFDPRALFPFKGKGYVRQLLLSLSYQYVWHFRHFFEGIDVEQGFLDQKRVQRYYKNHVVNAWTIVSKEQADHALPYVDTITFQNMDEGYIHEILETKNNQ